MSDSPKEPLPFDEALKRVWAAKPQPKPAPKEKAKKKPR
jgi:hypothetical protein